MEAQAFDVAKHLNEGIQACRNDKWREGFFLLTEVAREADRGGNLPPVFYSYLGVALARCEGRKRDGLELCRFAARRQPRQAEIQLNLATTYLMVGRRAAAVRALERGLRARPGHRRLLELKRTLGVRRPPMFRFLARSHPVNVMAGRVRSWLFRVRDEVKERREEEAAWAE